MATTLFLPEKVFAAHGAQLEKMKAQTVAQTAHEHGFPVVEGVAYSDDFFSQRFELMLLNLLRFVANYNSDPPRNNRMNPAVCRFYIDTALRSTAPGRFEPMLQVWGTEPSVSFAIWALDEIGLTAQLVSEFKDDFTGSIWIEVE
jgi:hypothetical protein